MAYLDDHTRTSLLIGFYKNMNPVSIQFSSIPIRSLHSCSIGHDVKQFYIRYQQIKDAKRFLEILSSPDFIYFFANPKSIAEEKRFLRQNKEKRLNNIEHNFTIVFGDEVVGAVGLRIDQCRRYIGEVGYFVDREYWGRGIASKAVGLVERFGFGEFKLKRIEIVTLKENIPSIRVAEKCGFRKEGIQRAKLFHDGQYRNAYLFAKIKRDS